jgi:CO dehydrogenase/acetyl-CoA synthase beta subunit
MFVIVASSAKSDIESKECVYLTKVDKIETYFDKTRVTFALLDAKNDAEYKLEEADVNYEFATSLALEFKQTQVIAIMP